MTVNTCFQMHAHVDLPEDGGGGDAQSVDFGGGLGLGLDTAYMFIKHNLLTGTCSTSKEFQLCLHTDLVLGQNGYP